jgi:exosome complex RNA-binding protein Rrp4
VKAEVNKHYKPVLTCIHPTLKKNFDSGEAYFTELKGGYLIEATQKLVTYLLSDHCHLLESLGDLFEFKINVGFNGRVWVDSP